MRAALVASLILFAAVAHAGDTDSPAVESEATDAPAAAPSTPLLPIRKPPEAPPQITEWRELPSGLKIADLKVGTGPSPVKGQPVQVEYSGWVAESGARFDSSYGRPGPFSFVYGAGQVILGWEKGLKDMQVGGRRVLLIPAYLGYGASGAGQTIPPHADLLFEVELLAVE